MVDRRSLKHNKISIKYMGDAYGPGSSLQSFRVKFLKMVKIIESEKDFLFDPYRSKALKQWFLMNSY